MRSSSSAPPPDRQSHWPVTATRTHCSASSTLPHDDVPRTSLDAATDSTAHCARRESLCLPHDARDSSSDAHDRATGWTTSATSTKRVTWSTITVHEFGVGVGGSAIATKGGPPIGLAETPEFTWTTNVGEMAECSEGVHRFSPSQRTRLLQAAGVPDDLITRHAREANIILSSRRRSKKMCCDERTGLEAEQERGDKETSRERLVCKRGAEQAGLEYPCAVYLQRPRMIPVNYA
ncbi:unnamed protein product [Hyaloperonospora brassicae]|uniref:Uncharacterized protein n=1 Tax=Hyaloperonospora brassicae TaxID=162125 RepID=A0AAV0TYV7_HYABA|nr:unnamed protein product [Hyaloperonospora brassicae]